MQTQGLARAVRRAAHDPVVVALTAVVVAAAVVRGSTLDLQSYYTDEAYTVSLVHESPIDLVRGIARTESTPPLYYAAAWLWSRLFGAGEVGLRSLSALAGTATVLFCFLCGARIVSRSAGLVCAALAAVSPFMVWYSQEARSYALFTLLTAASVFLYAGLRAQPRRGRFVAWAAVSAAAIWTHYFAVFVVVTEAVLLALLTPRSRRSLVVAASGAALASAPLLPLVVAQRRADNGGWIGELPLDERLRGAVQAFLSGHYIPTHLRVAAALLALLVAALLVLFRSSRQLAGAGEAALLGAGTVGLPLLAAAVGQDYWLARNVMPAWLAGAIVVAAAVTAARPSWIAGALAAALVAVSLVATMRTFERHELHRKDWRGLDRCLGAPNPARAVIVRSSAEALVLTLYRTAARQVHSGTWRITEIVVVGNAPENLRLPAEFASAGTACSAAVPVHRFAAPRPEPLSPSDLLAPSRDSDGAVVRDG
jgi:uncharacterized membrane protein